MPFLTFPLGLIGLIAVPTVVGIYFLRNRYKPKSVSSLFLWEAFTRSQEGGPRVTRLQFPLSLLLELLILTSLVFAAADPRWRVSTRLRPLLVVLDDSASMAIAKDEALEVIETEINSVDYERIRVVFAGTKPRVAGPAVRNWQEVETQLDGWTCLAPAGELETAISFAEDLGSKDTRVLVISDRAPTRAIDEGSRLRWRSTGTSLANVGFVNAGRTPSDGGKDRCFYEIANFDDEPAVVSLRVEGRDDEMVGLKSGEIKRVLFATPKDFIGKTVIASLPGDALASDNQVTLVADEPRPVKIMLNCRDTSIKRLVTRGLAAAGHKEFGNVDPDLTISDRPVPDLSNDERWVFEIFPEKNAQAFVGPFIVNTEHPLVDGVELLGSVWGASETNLTTMADLDPVVALGNTSLLAARPPRIRMHFKPELSTLQDNANWPILLWNLRKWRASYLPGLSEANVRVGAEVEIRTPADIGTVSVKGPEQTLTLSPNLQRARISPVSAGVHEVSIGNETFSFAANLLSPGESDLRKRSTGTWGEWIDEGVLRKEYRSTAWIWLLIALAAFLAHLWLMAARRSSAIPA